MLGPLTLVVLAVTLTLPTSHAAQDTLAEDTCPAARNSVSLFPNAKAQLVGIFDLSQPGRNGEACGEPVPTTLPSYEAVMWTLSRINQKSGFINGNPVSDSYVPGIQIGMRAYDTCSRTEVATRSVVDFFPNIYSNAKFCKKSTDKMHLGVIGSTFSYVSTHVANWLTAFKIPMISYASSALDLGDKNVYPYFMRTIPPDRLQTKVMVEVLKKLNWLYIGVVYTDETYGRSGQSELLRLANENYICIRVAVPIAKDEKDPAKFKAVYNSLLSVGVKGVIYIGLPHIAFDLINLAKEVKDSGKLQWFFSDSVGNIRELATLNSPYSRGFLAMTPSSRRTPEFQDHWMRIDENNPLSYNPWFKEWFMSINKCKLPGVNYAPYNKYTKNCPNMSQDEKRKIYVQNQYVLSAIDAVYTYANALKNARKDKCTGQASGACQALLDMTTETFFKEYLMKVNITFAKEERLYAWASYLEIPYYQPKRTSFTATGEIAQPSYDIWNFNQRPSNIYSYHRVGVYENEKFTLWLQNDLKMYTEDRSKVLPSIPASKCPATGCGTCLALKGATRFLYIPGNIHLTGLFSIHADASNSLCGRVRTEHAQLMEAFAFAIDRVKVDNPTWLNKVSLGAVGFDDCSSVSRAKGAVANFHSKQLDLRNPNTGQKIHPDSVEGYVASGASDTTISVAEILTPLRITQVSYAATSTELSNKAVYPYFLRTVPSDAKQVQAMVMLLKKMSWRYVQTIQEPTSYGKNGAAEFKRQAELAGICVTASHEFITHGSYAQILERMRQRPQAKVIIVFADSADVNGLLKVVKQQKAGGEFLLFGSELWGTSPFFVEGAEEVAVGSLSMRLRTPLIAEFEKYLKNLTLANNGRNPFYRQWYEAAFNCYLDDRNSIIYKTPCNTTGKITESPHYYQSQFAYYTINAVYAIVKGLGDALRFYCGATFTSVCKAFKTAANKKQQVFDKINAVQFTDIDQKQFRFIDGEGNAEYEIFSYWGKGAGKGYQKVASYLYTQKDWSQAPDTTRIRYFNNNPIISECSTGLACQSCLSKFQTKFLHIPGDVLLAGLFPIHKSGRNVFTCGGMKPFNGIQYLETMAYAVDQVNTGKAPVKLQGVKLGAIGLDDCSSEYLASSLVSSIHSGALMLSKNGVVIDRQKIRGWITYGSGKSIKVQEIVRGLRMAQISPSSTSTRLKDALLYPMLYRTVPMDNVQVRAIARLIKSVDWSCVQTVHSPTIYGQDAILNFKAAAKAEKICVSACYELFTDGNYDQIIQKLVDSSTKAVVIFAQADTYVRNLLEALRQAKLKKAVDLTFIASESWGQLKAVVRGYEAVIPNTMTMKVRAPEIPGFKTYVETLRVTVNNRNPWFEEYYQMMHECYLTDKSVFPTKCASNSMPLTNAKFEQENWVDSTMDAVYAFTAALDKTLKQVCGTTYKTLCSAFVQDDDINLKIFRNLQSVSFNSAGGGTFTFNADRAKTTGYDVAKVDASNTAAPYKEVGNWDNNGLKVTDPTLPTSYTNVPSRCAPCIECPYGQQALDKEKFVYLNGDILIGMVADVHEAGKEPFSCGRINMEFGAPLVEVFNFAIEQVNKKQGIFSKILPGVSLGGISVDSCTSAVRAGNLVADFHSGVITLQDKAGQVVDPDRVQLWVGDLTTAESIEMAEVLKILGIPQISYGATGYALSDRNKYPNFLRTVPADDKQARGLISFVKRWNMINVQLVSSPDSYGNYMSREFIRLSKLNGICVTADIVFKGNGTFTDSLADDVVSSLLKNPQASVVIVLLRGDYVNGFLKALDRGTNGQRKFFLIGSDTWGDMLKQVKGVRESILLDAVTFNIETADIPEFDAYLDAKNPNNYKRNPWFNEMYEAAFDCTIPNNIASYARTCSNTNLGIPRLFNYTQDPYALYVENAVYSAAIGIHHALIAICGEEYVGACPDFVAAGEKRQHIRSGLELVNFTDATRQPFRFILNGESIRGYHIYRIQKDGVTGNLTYNNIGSYNDTHRLKLDITYDPKWKSDCSADKCKACPNLVPKLSRFMQRKSYRDLNLVAFYNVHHKGGNYLGCGDLNMIYGFQRMMAFFYAIEFINNNTNNDFDSTMKLSGLAIDFCESTDQLRQDLFTYLNGDGLCNYAKYTEMLFPWTTVAYMTTSAQYSIIGNEFFTPLGLTSISPIATAVDLSDKKLHPYFLRTVPPDTLQARAMDAILGLFGWNYFMGVNTDDEYGRGAMDAMIQRVTSRGNNSYCVGARHTIPAGASQDKVKEIVRDLDRKRFGRVVVMFTNAPDTRKVLQAVKDLNLIGRFIFLGSESWANDVSIPRGLEDVARGALTLRIRSEPVPGFVKWMKEITFKHTKDIPTDWLHEYLQHLFKCRIESSIVVQRQYARLCSDNERITDDMIEDDPAILHTIIAAYVVAEGLSKTDECKGFAIDDCLWRKKKDERNRIIYEATRATQWKVLKEQLKNNSFDFKFTEQGYGDLGYSIYNYVRRPGSKSDYIYKRVGFWMEELEMPKGSYQGYSETGEAFTAIPISTCPRDVKCSCLTGGSGTSTIVERLYPPPPKNQRYHQAWGVAAATLSALGISIALIMFFYFLFFYPVRGGTSVLGYLLLFGCMMVYATNFAFLFHACPQTCAIRKYTLGISYAVCFAALLTKVLNTVRVDTYDDRFQAAYKRFTHPLGLFFIAVGIAFVQVIIATEWLILKPPEMEYVSYLGQQYPRCAPSDFYNEELLLSLIYPMFLIAVTLFFSALTWRSEDNCKESRWILVASFFCAACWLIWTIVSTKTQFKYRDGAVIVGNIICASLMLICIYARKIHFFNKYQKEIKAEKKEESELKEFPADEGIYGTAYQPVPKPLSGKPGSDYRI